MLRPLLFNTIGAPEILLIVLVVLLFFGGRKIPEMMKGIGKGVRAFKEGMNEGETDAKKEIAQTKETVDVEAKDKDQTKAG